MPKKCDHQALVSSHFDALINLIRSMILKSVNFDRLSSSRVPKFRIIKAGKSHKRWAIFSFSSSYLQLLQHLLSIVSLQSLRVLPFQTEAVGCKTFNYLGHVLSFSLVHNSRSLLYPLWPGVPGFSADCAIIYWLVHK